MIRRPFRTAWLLVMTMGLGSACTRHDTPIARRALELGPHRIEVSVPPGWDVLDQGAQKRFRKGELEIVLENLGKTEWDPALASLHDDRRRAIASRRAVTLDYHEAVDIETWNRLDHTWRQRVCLVRSDDDVIALHTPRMMDADTEKTFVTIRDSLHFVPSVRR